MTNPEHWLIGSDWLGIRVSYIRIVHGSVSQPFSRVSGPFSRLSGKLPSLK